MAVLRRPVIEPTLLGGRRCHTRLGTHVALPLAALAVSVISLCFTIATMLSRPHSPGSRQSVLDNVLLTGELKVLSPLDYAPFAQAGDAECPYGFGLDVDAAKALAGTLNGASVVLIRSSWETILRDFVGAGAHIAVGGISSTLRRRQEAAFSAPYLHSGKVLLARCGSPLLAAFTASHGSLAALDNPATHVVVNSGGTNELFIRQMLPKASIEVVAENGQQFRRIIDASALEDWVTVTDREEAQLMVMRHVSTTLCWNEAVLLTEDVKAFMLPRDDFAWAQYVDAWLAASWKVGPMNASLTRWLFDYATLPNGNSCPVTDGVPIRATWN